MRSEKATATKALTALSLARIVVYIVFWAVRGEALSKESMTALLEPAFGTQDQRDTAGLLDTGEGDDADTIGTLSDRPANAPGRTFFSTQQLFGDAASDAPMTLPGTTETPGAIASLEILGMHSPSATLRDDHGILYTYLGTTVSGLSSATLRLGGNIVEIGDKNDIQFNHLLGEKVQFINLPMYAQKQVLLVITFAGDQTRFIQIPYGVYYTAKPLLQERFGSFYRS